MKRIKIVLLIIFLLSIVINVKALEVCNESLRHKKYMEIPEDERITYIEPAYCDLTVSNQKEIPLEKGSNETAFPARYFSYDYGLVTPVKNQGGAGTCWAFASIGAFESNALKNGYGTYDLSESHLVYSVIGDVYNDSAGKQNKYSIPIEKGGTTMMSASYFFGGYQMLSENEWSYNDAFPKISFSQYKPGRKILSVKRYYPENVRNKDGACTNNEIEKMKNIILKEGAIVGHVYISEKYNLTGEHLRVDSNWEDVKGSNHSILIVGWDDNIKTDYFIGATRKGAWIVKNSWGTNWGHNGYFYVSYDDHFICGDVTAFSGVSTKTFDNTYKAAHIFGGSDIIYYNKAYFASTFNKKTNKNETLSRVSFATSPNVEYKVYMAPNKEISSTKEWKLLTSGKSDTYGINSVDISSQELIKNTFTIIVEYTIPGGISLETTCKDNGYLKNVSYEKNRNFYSEDLKTWQDMASFPVNSEVRNCAPVIYAYTNNLDDSRTINPTSVIFNKDKAYLVKGDKETLRVGVLPNNATYKTVTWTSSNPNVATVSQNGEIIAKSAGTATITATTSNGKSNSCTVTVYNNPVNPTSISLSQTSYNIEVGDYITLIQTLLPENTTNTKVTWTSSNTKVATVSEVVNQWGRVDAISAGTTTITATTSNGKKATCKITVIAKKIQPTSISIKNNKETIDIGSSKKLEIVFNPTNTTEKSVTWKSSSDKIAKVDSNGKVTGVGEGKATITATTSNGKKATCEVTVTKPKGVTYSTHIQSYGWEKTWKKNGQMSGTQGEAKRLEGIKIKLLNMEYSGNIEYRTHIQTYGWEKSFKKNGQMSGTEGEAKRLEAIQIKLSGEIANYYDVYYRVHAQHFGWLGWAKNGEQAGTAGYAYRLEGIEIQLVKKTDSIPSNINFNIEPFKQERVTYSTHVQDFGWQDEVSDGQMSGTQGQAKRLEGIKIKLKNQTYKGNIEYRTHIQSYGWEDSYKKNGELSGTTGKSKRLEAIQIRLTGEMNNYFDVYYRVHAQNIGWMNWAKNGAKAGTAGYAYRLEGIEIVIVKKNTNPPTRSDINNKKAYLEK